MPVVRPAQRRNSASIIPVVLAVMGVAKVGVRFDEREHKELLRVLQPANQISVSVPAMASRSSLRLKR